MILPGFLGGSYEQEHVSLDTQRTMNLYPVLDEGQTATKAVAGFRAVPGIAAFASGLDGPPRAMLVERDRLLVVGSETLYEVSATGTVTSRGSVALDGRRAYLTSNGTDGGGQVLVKSGASGYIFDLAANTLTAVSDVDFLSAYGPVWYRDGYFFNLQEGENAWQISALNDGSSWDGGDVAAKSITHDPLRAGCAVGRVIWLLGQYTTEPWYNNGATFPWTPVSGALIEIGIHAPASLATLGGQPYWIGSSERGALGAYRASSETTAERISTNAIERIWAGYETLADAVGWAYSVEGHAFYVVTFPDIATWVFDARTGFWHERGLWVPETSRYTPYEGRCHAYYAGRHLVGSIRSGAIYALSETTETEAATAARRWLRRVPAFQAEHRVTRHHKLSLDLVAGVGTRGTGAGADPVIGMRYSNDSGRTWSVERTMRMGAQGETTTVPEWHRLGQSRTGRAYEFTGSCPVPTLLTNAYTEVSYGAS